MTKYEERRQKTITELKKEDADRTMKQFQTEKLLHGLREEITLDNTQEEKFDEKRRVTDLANAIKWHADAAYCESEYNNMIRQWTNAADAIENGEATVAEMFKRIKNQRDRFIQRAFNGTHDPNLDDAYRRAAKTLGRALRLFVRHDDYTEQDIAIDEASIVGW